MTRSSVYPRQPRSRGTLATIFVAFTGWASYQPIARDGTCSSARAIYQGSQQRSGFHRTILSWMLGVSLGSAGRRIDGERQTTRTLLKRLLSAILLHGSGDTNLG